MLLKNRIIVGTIMIVIVLSISFVLVSLSVEQPAENFDLQVDELAEEQGNPVSTEQQVLSAEQQSLVEERLQSGSVPELSAEQDSLIKERLEDSSDYKQAEMSPEQKAVIESRLNAQNI